MKELKEDYERRLKTVLAELEDFPLDIEKETRLATKASCYRTFIAELNRVLKIRPVSNRKELLLAYSSSKENMHACRGEFEDEEAVDQWLANNCE